MTFTDLSDECGVAANTMVYCWVALSEGEIGNPDTPAGAGGVDSGSAFTQTDAGSGFVSVVSGSAFSCALNASGAALCWGDDTDGAVGNGAIPAPAASSVVDRPAAVVGGHSFAQLAAGASHLTAIEGRPAAS
jgi:alpha-tubulin suppressor-like RCC1 family protein